MSSESPANRSGAETPRGSGRGRKLLWNAVKIALGLGILVIILAQLEWDDRVRLEGQDEVRALRGRDLVVSDGFWRFQPPAGPELVVPIEDFPILEQKGTGLRVSIAGEDPIVVTSARLEGSFSFGPGDQAKPLADVAFDAGRNRDGWVEKIPAIKHGLVSIKDRLSIATYALAMALILSMYVLGVTRWMILLRAQGLDVPFRRAFQLTFIGFFFNNVVPGLTGGDLVKAVIVARDHPGRGAAAVSAVIVDRVIGILILALMSAIVLLFTFGRYPAAGMAIFLFLGGVAALVCLFFSRRIRRGLRLNELLKKLPGSGVLQKLDEAFLLYRERKQAVVWSMALSVVAHLCNVLAIFLMGMDLGVDRSAGLVGEPLVAYFATVPIVLIASSIPLLPGGWGLGELMYGYFFRTVGIRNLGLSVGLSVLSRVSMVIWSLLGGIFLIFHRQEARDAIRESEEARFTE